MGPRCPNSLKKCNPPDLKCYFGNLNKKKIPIRCNATFEYVFTAFNNTNKLASFKKESKKRGSNVSAMKTSWCQNI